MFTYPFLLTAKIVEEVKKIQIPRTRLSTVGSCTFSVFGLFCLQNNPSLISFKSNIKTFLFPKLKICHAFCSMLLFLSKSLFAAHFELCVNLVLYSQFAHESRCLCVCVCVFGLTAYIALFSTLLGRLPALACGYT